MIHISSYIYYSLAILVVSTLAPLGIAQNIKGSVSGTIFDPQKAIVTTAIITILHTETREQLSTTSNDAGFYRQPALDPGIYSLTVSAGGFNTFKSEAFELGLGDSLQFDVNMTLATFSETIKVSSLAPRVLQLDDTKRSRNFNAREMNDLPNASNSFAGRNFYTQALTTPGVSYSPLAHRPFAVNGQRPRNNNYMIDSVQVNDPSSGFIAGRGKTEQIISQEAVQGMEVITHNFKAEYGRNSGSIISIVSKRGSNQFHGSVYSYHLNSALRSRNFFENEKSKGRTTLTGFTASGPIKPDKAFFFGNYESNWTRGDAVRNFKSLTTEQRAQAVSAVKPLVDLYPESPSGSRIFAQGVPAPSTQNTYMVKTDIALTTNQNLMIRNNLTSNDSDLKNLGGFVGHHILSNRQTQSITAHHNYTATPNLVNEYRAGYMRFVQFDDMIEPLAIGDPTIHGEIGFMVVPGLSPAGTISFMGKDIAVNVYSMSNDTSWNRGNHSFKFGTSIRQNRIDGGTVNNRFAGTVFFPNVNSFLAGQPLSYTRNIGNPHIGLRRNEWDVYLQDDWRIAPTLTLNLGVRYELFTSPTEMYDRIPLEAKFPTDKNNFAPRFGLAWNTAKKTVVRAGWGLFYNALEMDFVGLTRFNPPNVVTLSAFRPQLPNLLANAREATPSGVTIPNQDTATPYAQHYNLTIEQELWSPQTTVTAAYVGTIGSKIARVRLPNGGENISQGSRPNPSIGVINRLETSGSSNYHAFQLGMNQRLSNFVFKAAYTWSKFIDDVSELPTENTRLAREILPLEETNLKLDRGRSDFDLPHTLTFSYLWQLPSINDHSFCKGWSISGVTTLQSGRPYSLYTGTDNRTGTDNNRIFEIAETLTRNKSNAHAIKVVGGLPTALQIEPATGLLGTIGRNTESRDGFYTWNVGLSKEFTVSEVVKIQLRGEIFNSLNTTNFDEIDNVLGVTRARDSGQPTGFNPNFGRYTEAFPARNIQLALRVVF